MGITHMQATLWPLPIASEPNNHRLHTALVLPCLLEGTVSLVTPNKQMLEPVNVCE